MGQKCLNAGLANSTGCAEAMPSPFCCASVQAPARRRSIQNIGVGLTSVKHHLPDIFQAVLHRRSPLALTASSMLYIQAGYELVQVHRSAPQSTT